MSYVTTKPAWLAYTGLGAVTLPAGFDANNPLNWCGSCAAVQRMLADLGFYMGEFDGNVTGPVRQSFQSFAQSKGLNFDTGITTQLCTALRDAWLKLQSGGKMAATTTGRVALKTITPAVTTTRIGGGFTPPSATPETPPIPLETCPPGSQGIPPNCIQVPGGGGSIADECVANGGTWDINNQQCVYPGDVVPVEICSGWWSCMSTGGKVALIGGSVAVVGLVAFLALRK